MKKILIITSDYAIISNILNQKSKYSANLNFLFITTDINEIKYSVNNENIIIAKKSNVEYLKNILKPYIKKYDYITTLADQFLCLIDPLKEILEAKSFHEVKEFQRNKEIQKQILTKKNICVPKGFTYSNVTEFIENWDDKDIIYPLIVKPSNGYGSYGVKIVYNYHELLIQVRNICRINNLIFSAENYKCNVIIEEFIEGEEFSVDIIWKNYKPIRVGILSKLLGDLPYFPDYVYYVDLNLDEFKCNELSDLAIRVGESFGIKNGATHTEIKYSDMGKPYVLETGFRPGGGGHLYRLFSLSQQENFLDIYFNVMSDEIINESYTRPIMKSDNFYQFLLIYKYNKGGTISKIEYNVENIPNYLNNYSVEKLMNVGDRVTPPDLSLKYIIWIIGEIEKDACKQKSIKECINEIELNFNVEIN